ncbi:MAG: GTP 3',8-cyclase MoaA [Melioribacteraceae bacterium]|nr:GTP 3',8-cyclase MoaA [Melioribacteraceae bacterium]
MKLIDTHNRTHNYLRISLTDKCNLNCTYCNPSGNSFYGIQNSALLSNEELLRLIKIFVVDFEFTKIRLTGGEPLARNNILDLLESIGKLKSTNPFELGITTNGTFLLDKLESLKGLGLDKLNISLDTLDRLKYKSITGADKIDEVFSSIHKAITLSFSPIKINTVIMKGVNDDEIIEMVTFAIEKNLNIRFIEFMPFQSNGWNDDNYINYEEIKKIVEKKYRLIPIHSHPSEVAKSYAIKGNGGTVSFISSISNHFCGDCNRLRITADGKLKLCLFSPKKNEISLKSLLRSAKYNDADIANVISDSILNKKLKHPEIDELLKLESNNMLQIGG